MAPQYKSYYDEETAWNDDGKRFGMELAKVLTPLIQREFAAGFNPAEIMDMIVSDMQSTLCECRIRFRNYHKERGTTIQCEK